MTTGHIVYCDRNCNQLLLDWATTASTGLSWATLQRVCRLLASGKPRTLQWLLFCCPVTCGHSKLSACLQAAVNSELQSAPLERALRTKPYWDSLTDEQRDELLTVDLQSLQAKAASASGKSTLKLQPRGSIRRLRPAQDH